MQEVIVQVKKKNYCVRSEKGNIYVIEERKLTDMYCISKIPYILYIYIVSKTLNNA